MLFQTLSLPTHHLPEALRGAGSRPGEDVVRISHRAAHLSQTAPARAPAVCG